MVESHKYITTLYTGSLLFCPDCGTLLDLPESQAIHVKCEQCGHLEPASCKAHPYVLSYAHID